jgi:hypothetical protein
MMKIAAGEAYYCETKRRKRLGQQLADIRRDLVSNARYGRRYRPGGCGTANPEVKLPRGRCVIDSLVESVFVITL